MTTTKDENTLKDEIGGTDLTDKQREQREAMKDLVREMQKKVIPDIVAAVKRREELAHLSRLGVLPIIKRLQDERDTENTMYKAWRKRATEAEEREGILEGKFSRLTAERDALEAQVAEMLRLFDEVAEGTEIELRDGNCLYLCDDHLWRSNASHAFDVAGYKSYQYQGFTSPLEAFKAVKEKDVRS